MAEEGTEYVIQRYRNPTQNLRTHIQRIIRKAGVEPWVKLWQNLRSSRETELVERFPIQVVTAWLGNTPAVAMKHYLQVTDDHWKRAVLEDTTHSQGGTECAPVPSGLGMNRVACGSGDKVVSVDSARRNTYTQERAGVNNARERTRTSTGFYSHQHLKLARLPIPPLALKGREL